MKFDLKSDFKPTGDQPQAIEKLTHNLEKNISQQVLLGVTGSGKTFTMANVIAKFNKPTLIISHNKTLAGQLYQEFRDFKVGLLNFAITLAMVNVFPLPVTPKS